MRQLLQDMEICELIIAIHHCPTLPPKLNGDMIPSSSISCKIVSCLCLYTCIILFLFGRNVNR